MDVFIPYFLSELYLNCSFPHSSLLFCSQYNLYHCFCCSYYYLWTLTNLTFKKPNLLGLETLKFCEAWKKMHWLLWKNGWYPVRHIYVKDKHNLVVFGIFEICSVMQKVWTESSEKKSWYLVRHTFCPILVRHQDNLTSHPYINAFTSGPWTYRFYPNNHIIVLFLLRELWLTYV